MYSKAIQKLRTEIENNKKTLFVQVVGEFLLQHLNNNHQDAEKVMAEDKTLLKSIEEMWKVAKTKKVGNCAGMTGEEGMAIVFKYFGIGTGVDTSIMATAPTVKIEKSVAVQKKSSVDFNVSLDDFL